MTLLEALKHLSIEDADTGELIWDEDFNYDLLIHNLKEISTDEAWDFMNTQQVNKDVLESLFETKDDKYIDDNLESYIVNAAFFAHNDIELPYDEEFYQDPHDYDLIFSGDIDYYASVNVNIDI